MKTHLGPLLLILVAASLLGWWAQRPHSCPHSHCPLFHDERTCNHPCCWQATKRFYIL